MTTARGFVSLGLILALLIGLAVLGGVGWFATRQISNPPATKEANSSTTQSTVEQASTPANTTTPADISVPGMSKYTDSDFGFSFWYPDGWTVQQVAVINAYAYPGGIVVKRLTVVPDTPSEQGFIIDEYSSPAKTITDLIPACPMGMGNCADTTRYYFDTNTRTWMTEYPDGTRSTKDGSYILQPATTVPANVSRNTMGGLHMFYEGMKSDGRIVPVSGQHFLITGPIIFGIYSLVEEDLLAKTIVATDPPVATPVSAAEQTATIQAEKDAYAGQ